MRNSEENNGNYLKFIAMISTSVVAMFFLMYLHSYRLIDHAWFSETRMYMAFIMGGAMLIIMLSFMLQTYKSSKMNIALFSAGALILLGSIWLVRSQATVDGVDYMEGMIPHHSIAILTSERAKIVDPRVSELADEIIKAQRREIKEMEWLIDDIRENGFATTQAEAEARPVPDFMGTPE
ncbi:MAG: DUF305 domain-containing protein [Chloroflexota bacterium]|jgi:hypothetical protein|nr:DUF305 domain-containing protein [Chloroflexota bacterium]